MGLVVTDLSGCGGGGGGGIVGFEDVGFWAWVGLGCIGFRVRDSWAHFSSRNPGSHSLKP